jgi:hypothetical protein
VSSKKDKQPVHGFNDPFSTPADPLVTESLHLNERIIYHPLNYYSPKRKPSDMKPFLFACMLAGLLAVSCNDHSKEKELERREAELREKENELLEQKKNELAIKESELEDQKKNLENQAEKLESKKRAAPSAHVYAAGAGMYPFTASRSLTYADVAYKSAYELKLMRNEIFARHGYIFKSDDLRNYFNAQPWYRPMYTNVDGFLSALEKANISFIKSYE